MRGVFVSPPSLSLPYAPSAFQRRILLYRQQSHEVALRELQLRVEGLRQLGENRRVEYAVAQDLAVEVDDDGFAVEGHIQKLRGAGLDEGVGGEEIGDLGERDV